MRSRTRARAVNPVPEAGPAGLDSDLESALLAGLSEEEEDESLEEFGAPATPEAAPEAPPAREATPEPEGAPHFERQPAPDGSAEAGALATAPAAPNGPEPRPSEGESWADVDFDAGLDFSPEPAPAPEPSPEPPGTGVDELLARLADDDDDDGDENAGAILDLGVDEVPGGKSPPLDPASDPDVSGANPSPEVSGPPAADRGRPREAAEPDFAAGRALGGESAPGKAEAGPELRSWMDEEEEKEETEEGPEGGEADILALAAAMDEAAAADDPFPPFAVEDTLADAVEDGPGLGDVVDLGEALGLGDDPAAVHDPIHEAGPGFDGPAALDREPPPGDEPAREDAAPGGPFDDPIGAWAEAGEAVAESGAEAAAGGLPATGNGNGGGNGTGAETEAATGADTGFPAAEPEPAALRAPSPIATAAEPEPEPELETPAPFAFATDPESERVLREGLSDHPLPQVWPGDLRTAVATLGAGHAPRLLFVDIDETAYPAGAIHELAGVCEVGTAVIAFGSNPTARFSREILLAGVSDYLVKPLTPEAVREAAMAAAGAAAAGTSAAGVPVAAPTGWSVGFAGTGGSGSTTLAAATTLLAAERGRYVSVLDLDRTFPTLAFLLDVEPASGLVELLSTAARASLHPEMLDAMRASRGDRIVVYGYPWSAVPPPPPPVWAVCELIEELQRRSHLVIVDGLDDPATRLALLAVTDGRVLVVEPTGAGAPAAARLLDRLGPMAAPERAALVVQNHTRAFKAKAAAAALRDAGVEAEPDVVVPFESTLPAVTDRGWPNDRLPKPLRKPLATLADRVLAGERATAAAEAARA